MRTEFIKEKIKLIVYDFDGIMTDNRALVFQDGREAVFINRSDGLAISLIKKAGITQMIISTEKNTVVQARADKLGIEIIQCVENKAKILKSIASEQNIPLDEIVFFGNDLNDLEAMKLAGQSIASADACREVKEIASLVTKSKGGEGVIREFYDLFNKLI